MFTHPPTWRRDRAPQADRRHHARSLVKCRKSAGMRSNAANGRTQRPRRLDQGSHVPPKERSRHAPPNAPTSSVRRKRRPDRPAGPIVEKPAWPVARIICAAAAPFVGCDREGSQTTPMPGRTARRERHEHRGSTPLAARDCASAQACLSAPNGRKTINQPPIRCDGRPEGATPPRCPKHSDVATDPRHRRRTRAATSAQDAPPRRNRQESPSRRPHACMAPSGIEADHDPVRIGDRVRGSGLIV